MTIDGKDGKSLILVGPSQEEVKKISQTMKRAMELERLGSQEGLIIIASLNKKAVLPREIMIAIKKLVHEVCILPFQLSKANMPLWTRKKKEYLKKNKYLKKNISHVNIHVNNKRLKPNFRSRVQVRGSIPKKKR